MQQGDEAARLRAAIARLARRLNASAAVEGLTPSQASFLALVAARGPVGLAELTAVEGLHPTMASRIVADLVRRGLIERVPNPADNRAVVLEATAKGHVLRERIREERDRVVAEALDKLPTRDREAIVRALPSIELLVLALGGQPRIAETGSG